MKNNYTSTLVRIHSWLSDLPSFRGQALFPCIVIACLMCASQSQAAQTTDQLGVISGFSNGGGNGQIVSDTATINSPSANGWSLKFDYTQQGTSGGYWLASRPLPKALTASSYDTLCFDIKVTSSVTVAGGTNNSYLVVNLTENKGTRWIAYADYLGNLTHNAWVHKEISKNSMPKWDEVVAGTSDWTKIRSVSFQPCYGSSTFYIDNLKLKNSTTGATTNLLALEDDGYSTPTVRTMQVAPAKGTALLPYGIGNLLQSPDMKNTPMNFASAVGSTLAVPLIGFDADVASVATDQNTNGVKTLHYSQIGSGYAGWLTRHQLWDTAKSTAGVTSTLNTTSIYDFTSAADFVHTAAQSTQGVYTVGTDKIDKMARAGISTWVVPDYVFPWESNFGFSTIMTTAFNDDLKGYDIGIVTRNSGVDTTIKFRDYFYFYNRFYPDTPSDFGFTGSSWTTTTFVPPHTGNESSFAAKQTLFWFLRSYEYVKLADSLGRYHTSKGGNGLWVIPNPESPTGSSDFVTLVRSKGVGNLFLECFGKPGHLSEAAYASTPYLREQADRAGNRLSVLFETGAGGNSTPYWTWPVTYTAAYELSAATKADTNQSLA
jgi:hypothetical protein